jgi:hypothetical protein
MPRAFAVGSALDSLEETVAYQTLPRPEGARKDSFRWTAQDERPDEKPIAELESIAPGPNSTDRGPPLGESPPG